MEEEVRKRGKAEQERGLISNSSGGRTIRRVWFSFEKKKVPP